MSWSSRQNEFHLIIIKTICNSKDLWTNLIITQNSLNESTNPKSTKQGPISINQILNQWEEHQPIKQII